MAAVPRQIPAHGQKHPSRIADSEGKIRATPAAVSACVRKFSRHYRVAELGQQEMYPYSKSVAAARGVFRAIGRPLGVEVYNDGGVPEQDHLHAEHATQCPVGADCGLCIEVRGGPVDRGEDKGSGWH